MNEKPTYEKLVQKIHDLEAQIRLSNINSATEKAGTNNLQGAPIHQRVEDELQASKEMLQLVMDNIPQSIFWKDRNSVFLGCNRNFASEAGVNIPEEIIGKTDYDLAWKKEEADFYRECDHRIMENDQPEYHIVEPQLQAGGRQAWLDTNKIPLHDPNGNVIGILGTYENITERVKTQESLRLYQKIVATTSDLMAIIDSN